MSEATPLDADLVRWTEGSDDQPLLVLLHGYGADEHDLFRLAAELPERFRYAAVRAPLSAPWPAPGYSWYAIEERGDRWDGRVTEAARGLLDWLDLTVGLDREVGLLGFSQGASVALQAMRLAPERFSFVVNLAGYVAGDELSGDETLAAHPVPVFWGRGARDEVIPRALVEQTAQWLPAHTTLSGRVYPDLAHGVSAEELDDVRAFLEAR